MGINACRFVRAAVCVLLFVVGLSAAHAAPARVVPPNGWGSIPRVQIVCEFLAERLKECKGVDIIGGSRAVSVINSLHTGAFELTEEARWQRLRSFVALDAMITVASIADNPAATVEVRIYRAGGVVTLKAAVPDGATPDLLKTVTSLGEQVGQALKLGPEDIKTLSDPRIEDPAVFRFNYMTFNPTGAWPLNPYTSAIISLASMSNRKPSWALDVVYARCVAAYIQYATHRRNSEKQQQAQSMARGPLLRLMGTEHEAIAYGMLQVPRVDSTESYLTEMESMLMQIAQPLAVNSGKAAVGSGPGVSEADLEELGGVKPADKAGLKSSVEKPSELSSLTGQTTFTAAQRMGALRMLGAMASPKAMGIFRQLTQAADAKLRETTAVALAGYKDDASLALLKTLATDEDETVAFTAGRSLAIRKQTPADFHKRAIAMLQKGEPHRTQAAVALASDATVEDVAILARLAADEMPSVRAAFRRTQGVRSGAAAPKLADVMQDADADAVLAGIRAVPRDSIAMGNETFQRLARLGDDPDANVAQAARDALAPLRPTDAAARARFDLTAAMPYVRQRTIAMLKSSKEPWARAELIAACNNSDPHTRVEAMRALAQLDPTAARGPLLAALAEAHLYVRFHAAAFLAPVADASQAAAIREAIPRQKDRATILYLRDALARVAGEPAPPPQPPAILPTGDTTLAWYLGAMSSTPDSPYRMLYKPSHGNHVRDDPISDSTKATHASGRAYYYNVGPLGESGLNIVDPTLQDRNWLYLDDQLDTIALPYIDGVELGNSNIHPDSLWPAGWRFFCDEAGIDPARIAGEKKNLTPVEARAWSTWGLRRCIDGRNKVYDYMKLKFGRLHPGFQIAVSLPGTGGAAMADWKFDVAFHRTYSYNDSRQDMYNVIRRAKTLWPERPVFWMGESLSTANVPNLAGMAILKWDFKPITEPLIGRTFPAYTDALTAWIAGADPGWGVTWCLRKWNWGGDPDYSGYSITPEDCTFNSARLREAIEYAFNDTEPVIRERDAMIKANAKGPAPPPSEKDTQLEGMLEGITKPDSTEALKARIVRDKEALYLGFQFLGKHLLDIGRLFASLPRNNHVSDALLVRPEPTDPPQGPAGSAGADLLADFDCIFNLEEASRIDLKRYKFIAVHDPSAVSDESIAGLTKWLKETPGVLYVHINLTADNSRQAATPELHDGALKLDWPWEKDITIADKAGPEAKLVPIALTSATGTKLTAPDARISRQFTLAGPAATAVLSAGNAPTLVVWRHADFKGVVVFDALSGGGTPYREELRRTLAELKAKSGVGIELRGPQRHNAFTTDKWIANATTDGDPQTLTGVDLLTGDLNPVVGAGRSAAFIGGEFQGKFAATLNGVSVLCDKPIRKIEKIPGGMRIECDGLIQAASSTGKLDARAAAGAQPPEIKPDARMKWLMLEDSEGLATLAIGDGKTAQPATLVHVRCRRPLTIVTRP